MEKDHFQFKTKDSTNIFVYAWIPQDSTKTKAVLQISHGMAEHAARYQGLAEYLNSKGYAVYANDHRGHGRTAGGLENIGFLAQQNGWDLAVADIRQLSQILKKKHPDIPLFALGHSMGGLLLRDYISHYGSEIQGAIILSTSDNPFILCMIGQVIASIEIMAKGAKNRSELLDKMSFGKYNSYFSPNATKFDWLSSDTEAVRKYVDDPYCGEIFTSSFFKDLTYGVRKISSNKYFMKVPKDLPLLFLAGKNDPVGNMTKGVLKVIEKYIKAGIKDIEYIFFERARHEILNEKCKNEVYRHISDWLDEKILQKESDPAKKN